MTLLVSLLVPTLILLGVLAKGTARPSFAGKFHLSFAFFRSAVLVAFAVAALLVTVRTLRGLPTKSDLTHPESAVLMEVQERAATGRLYLNIDRPPYTPTPYGPFFYLSLRLARTLAGGDLDRTRIFSRAFVCACFLLVPVAIYALLRKIPVPDPLPLLGALASISAYFFLFWNVSVRPDLPCILLSLLAIWMVVRRPEEFPRVSPVRMIFAGLLCASALLMKQSYLAAPLAITVFLLSRRRVREFLLFVGSAAVLALLVIGILQHAGEPVLQQLLLVSKSPLDLRHWPHLLVEFLPVGLGVLLFPFASAGFFMNLSSERSPLSLYAYYFLFSTVLGLTTMLQVGGDSNYFLEMWIAASLLFPPAFANLEHSWQAVRPSM